MDQSKFEDVRYIQGVHGARLAVNDSFFSKLDVMDSDEELYELSLKKRVIKHTLPIYLAFFILNLAKLRQLEFTYDYLYNYWDRSYIDQCQTDTDSNYIAIAAPSLEQVPFRNSEMKEQYFKAMYQNCNDLAFLPDAVSHFEKRKCCYHHEEITDKFCYGVYKLEFSGTVIIALCSKCYVCDDFDAKEGGNLKFSSKGLNKNSVIERAEIQKTSVVGLYKKVLDSGIAESAINTGIKPLKENVVTYSQSRAGLSFLYCKRIVLEDGIRTLPLNVTLTPYKLKKNSENMD